MLLSRARQKLRRLALDDNPRLRTLLTLTLYISVTARELVNYFRILLELKRAEHSANEKPLVYNS
jgi:hypothetical protein